MLLCCSEQLEHPLKLFTLCTDIDRSVESACTINFSSRDWNTHICAIWNVDPALLRTGIERESLICKVERANRRLPNQKTTKPLRLLIRSSGGQHKSLKFCSEESATSNSIACSNLNVSITQYRVARNFMVSSARSWNALLSTDDAITTCSKERGPYRSRKRRQDLVKRPMVPWSWPTLGKLRPPEKIEQHRLRSCCLADFSI